MGLFDWLKRKPAEQAGEDFIPGIPSAAFIDPDDPSEYEETIRAVAALADLRPTVRVHRPGRALVVELELEGSLWSHVQESLFVDLEALLPHLNQVLADAQLVEVDDGGEGEDFVIAYATPDQIAELRKHGMSVRFGPGDLDPTGLASGLPVRDPQFHDDGTLWRGTLLERTDIDQFPCAPGPISFWHPLPGQSRGNLEKATLAQDFALGALTLPTGTEIFIWEELRRIAVADLRAPLAVAGLVLPAGSSIEMREDEDTIAFVRLGAPVSVTSEGPYRGQQLPADTLLSWTDGGWDFDDADVPEPVVTPASPYTTKTLSEAATIGGYAFPAGTKVTLREDRLMSADLPSMARLDGIPCAAGRVGFSLGKLHTLMLAEDHRIGGVLFRKDWPVAIWGPDALAGGTLAEDAEIDGVALLEGTYVDIYEELGTLCQVVLARAQTIRGRKFVAGQSILFDTDGSVRTLEHIADLPEFNIVSERVPYIELE